MAVSHKKYVDKRTLPPPIERRCVQVHPHGEQCKARKMHGYEFCYFHEPTFVDFRFKASAKGAKMASIPLKIEAPVMESHEDVRQFAVEALHQVRTGEMDPRTAAVISSLISHVLKTLPDVEASTDSPADKLRKLLMGEEDVPEIGEDGEAGEALRDNGPENGEAVGLHSVRGAT